MPDYSLGRAHGKIEIDYQGDGARKAAKDLDQVADSSSDADKSLTKTQKTLKVTDREFESAGSSAGEFQSRLKDVRRASDDADAAQRRYNATLLDSKATTDDIADSLRDLEDARKRHTKALESERDAHNALTDGMSIGRRAMDGFSNLLPNLSRNLDRLSVAEGDASGKANTLASSLGAAAKVVAWLGPQGRAASVGLMLASDGIEKLSSSAQSGGSVFGDFVKQIAGFELAVGKVSGLALGAGSLGGLGGLAGAAGVQGIVNLAGAARQLTGVLGLLPAVVSGVGFSMGTLDLAFRGVGDALTDMMADDPKKFLEDIKDMGPVAAQAMLDIAGFRDQFRMVAGGVQDSFFSQIAADIAPLIQTWLPAVAQGMSQIAGIFGQAAHEFLGLLQQPQMMAAFESFVSNIGAGLQSLTPAISPLLQVFTQLTVTGASFFQQIGGDLTNALNTFSDLITNMAASGSLQQWIQNGINAFERLGNILFNVGYAFGNIMDVAEQFGGGGLLGWLEQLSGELANWTTSTEGQKALTDFFSTVREATDAFLPMLGPLVDGLSSIAVAFVKLGVATAPGWQVFFDTFAQTMAQLGPQIVGIAPALNTFLTGLSKAFADLMASVGPQLPQIFQMMANAFVALLPQVGPLVSMFLELAQRVGPQLPKFFEAVTAALEATRPYWPIIIGFVRNFVSAVTWFIELGGGVIGWFTKFLEGVKGFVDKVPGAFVTVMGKIEEFFRALPGMALEAGKSLLANLAKGLADSTGLGSVLKALGSVGDLIHDFWKTSSPSKRGPLHEVSPNEMGARVARNFAAGMVSAQGSVASAAASTAGTVSGTLGAAVSSVTVGRASAGTPAAAAGGADAVGGALLPPWIAGADDSVLSAYLQHQFPENRGLKGLANDLGEILGAAQSGFNLVTQGIMAPMFTALGLAPGLNAQRWTKMSPEALAAQQQQESERKSLQDSAKQGPSWDDVLGPGVPDGLLKSPSDGPPSRLQSGASVPLVQNPDGTWTSPNPAWAHLIARESSGVNQRQKITDVNSGGNEAEGIFQITPATWRAHGGADFASNPLAASVQQQAAIAARILQRNPSGSDWGAGLPGRESAQALLSGLTGSAPASPKSPPWAQVTGSADAQDSSGYISDAALLASVPAGRYTQSQDVDLTKGLADCSSAVEDLVNLMDGQPTGGRSMSTHNADEWLTSRGFLPGSMDGAFNVGFNAGHMQATLPGGTPFNWGSDASAARRGIGGTGAFDPAFTSHYYRPVTGGGAPPATRADSLMAVLDGGGLPVANGDTVDELLDTSQKTLSVNDQLLQAYLQGNPALASQIDAAKVPGASDTAVLGALTSIDTTIADLRTQDATGNKNTIDALQGTQRQLAQSSGFQESPSALSTAQSIASGAANAVTGAFQVLSSGLDVLTATQDIADRLVYGVRNTEDIMKLIDNVQKYITFAADIANETGSILSTIGGLVGAGAGADPSGATAGASAALSMAATISQLIGAALQGVNMAIDLGQEVYHMIGNYVGQGLSQLVAGLTGDPLMGDVRLLLNKNTGQLITYSQDNPGNQNYLTVPKGLNKTYDYGGGTNPNPGYNQQWNIYAGPGQSTSDMLNETMWMVATAGTTGAMAPVNF